MADTLNVLGAMNETSYWSWIDAFFMSAPTFARAALVSGDSSFHTKLVSIFNATAYG